MIDRRLFMLLLLLAACPSGAQAKDDGDSGGRSGGDDDDHGDDGDSGGRSRNRRSRDDDEDDEDDEDDGDRDRIRTAVRQGRARPLRDILDIVRASYRGQVVRVRLMGRGDRLVYRIRLIDSRNALINLDVEAATGRVLKVTGL